MRCRATRGRAPGCGFPSFPCRILNGPHLWARVGAKGPETLSTPTACDCGTRLCDELTGQCICPPRTVPPDCLVCQPQSFGCHPLVGCEECNCSGPGVQELTDPTCDMASGQCK